jgi:uridine kinase
VGKVLLIGVAGGTGSGKTTVARELVRNLDAKRVAILPEDAYYRDQGHLPPAERAKVNYDHPDAIDHALLVEHVRALARGEPIARPVYSFVEHVRLAETVAVPPCDVVILEGILLLAYPELRDLLDIKVFVDTEDDIRFIRRLKRDIEDRGRTVASVIEQYVGTVRLMHREFVEPSKRHADLIVPEGGFNRVAIDVLLAKIAQVLG